MVKLCININFNRMEELNINSTEKEGCTKCKNKGLSKTHWMMLTFSFYVLATSIYGSIVLIKKILVLF
jgi:hypothetical protein